MPSTELVKPGYKVFEPCYDFHQVMHYLEKKYDFDMHDVGGKYKYYEEAKKQVDSEFGEEAKGWYTTGVGKTEAQQAASNRYNELLESAPPYQNFWHIYSDEIAGNGSFLWMGFGALDPEYGKEEYEDYPEWAKPILRYIKDEFGATDKEEDYIKFWVSW